MQVLPVSQSMPIYAPLNFLWLTMALPLWTASDPMSFKISPCEFTKDSTSTKSWANIKPAWSHERINYYSFSDHYCIGSSIGSSIGL